MKAQDILTLSLLLAHRKERLGFTAMSSKSHLSIGEVHASLKRLSKSGLIDLEARQPKPLAVQEFLLHGLRYVFPAIFSGKTQGMATATGASPLKQRFNPDAENFVWPWEEGGQEGPGLAPVYPKVPQACAEDPLLYEWMALCDALRAGRARERKMAMEEISLRLGLPA
jgi:hypothetical protein